MALFNANPGSQSWWTRPALSALPPAHPFANSPAPTWTLGRAADDDLVSIAQLELSCHLYDSEPSAVLSHARSIHRVSRLAYDHRARKERPSTSLSRAQFPAQFIAEIDRALKQYAEYAQVDELAAGAAFNNVFWTGLRAGSPELLMIALAEPHWRICHWYRRRLVDVLVECADKVQGEVLSLLIADRQRFGAEVVCHMLDLVDPWLALPAAGPRDKQKVEALVRAVLQEPQVNPGVVWQRVLQECMDRAVEPRLTRMGEPLVHGGWQQTRATAARRAQAHRPCSNPIAAASSTSQPFSRIILDLPSDVQLHVIKHLDFDSMCRLRSCCRQLRSDFPLGCFAQQFLERELHFSSHPGYTYNSARFQSLMDSVPGNRGPSTLDCRMLVEAVRHLDIDLAMRFLSPTDPAYDSRLCTEPGFVRYVHPWALYVLLFESNVLANVAGARRLLLALLAHPELPDAACVLLALAYPTIKPLFPLPNLDHALTPTRQYLVHLLESGTFPPTTPDAVRDQLSDPTSATSQLVVAFALVHFSPSKFAQLVNLVPVDQTRARSIYVQSLVRLAPDKLAECTDTVILDRVLDWMLLELESPGGFASPDMERVVAVARRVHERRRVSIDEVDGVHAVQVERWAERIDAAEAKMQEEHRRRAVEQVEALGGARKRAEGGCRMCFVQ